MASASSSGAGCAITRRPFEDLSAPILDGVDLAIDGGRLTGLPSTVVDLTAIEESGEWTILREGGISAGDLAAHLDSI